MTEIVLVTGATGFIGRVLVKRLASAGLRVRCLVRPGADVARLTWPRVESCRGDLLDAALPAAEKAGGGRLELLS